MAGWANNAHKGSFVKIYYPYHPFFGQELKVVRVDKGRIIHVKASDGDVRGIPIWMTNQDICQKIKKASYAFCSLNALKNLRDLLQVFKDTS